MCRTGTIRAPDSAQAGTIARRRAVVSCAMTLSWMWLVPLAGLCALMAFFDLVFAEFAAEGLDRAVTAQTILFVVGGPGIVFLITAAAGLAAAWQLARWSGSAAALIRVRPWLLGTGAALAGALGAALAYKVLASAF